MTSLENEFFLNTVTFFKQQKGMRWQDVTRINVHVAYYALPNYFKIGELQRKEYVRAMSPISISIY